MTPVAEPPPAAPPVSEPEVVEEEPESFGYTVYPTDAPEGSEAPPATRDGVGVAAGCSVIAVGEGWWDLAREAAQQAIHVTGDDPVDAAFRLLPSACQVSNPATSDLRLEIESFVEGLY